MGICAIAHNGNTRDKTGRFYEVIIYIALNLFPFIPVIQFEVLRILVLWMEMDTDKVTVVSVPIGVKNYTYLPGRVKFCQGGRILLFSMEYVKYRKVTKCIDLVIKLLIDQNRLQPYFGTFPEGSLITAPGGLEPSQPLIIFVHVCFRYCVCGRVNMRCNAREHALARPS